MKTSKGVSIQARKEKAKEPADAPLATPSSTASSAAVALPAASLPAALEALLFAANRPLTTAELSRALGVSQAVVEAELQRLQRALDDPSRGVQLTKEAGGWRLLSKPEWGPLIARALYGEAEPKVLSRSALEVLAVVAYRQPITRAEIDEIRGVRSDRVLARLMEEGLVEVAGRAEGLGRPLLFRTTPRFLEFVGLSSLEELPPLDAEAGAQLAALEKGLGQLPLHISPSDG